MSAKDIVAAYKKLGSLRAAARALGISHARVGFVVKRDAPQLMHPPGQRVGVSSSRRKEEKSR